MNRPTDSCASFPATRWSLLRRAATNREALGEFIRAYWRPMRAFLVRIGVPRSASEDRVQQFLIDKILTGSLLARADAALGRFRPLLKQALRNYAIDCFRREQAERQGTRQVDAVSAWDAAEVPAEREAADAFDVEWTREILGRTLQRFRDSVAPSQWQVFRARVWDPLTRGTVPAEYRELQRSLPGTVKQLNYTLVNSKRQFASVLREVIAEYAETEAAARDELDDLLRVLLASNVRGQPWPCDSAPAAGSGSQQTTPGVADDGGLQQTDPASLAAALRLDVHSFWDDSELDELLATCFAEPVTVCPAWDAAPPGLLLEAPGPCGEGVPTLGQLLQQPQPDLAALEGLKRAARSQLNQADPVLPRRVAETLYFAAIAAALVRRHTRISTSPDNVLRSGFSMLLGCPWLEPWLQQLLLEARQSLERD
jgi:DNA-directed RNA polymerase specialized sigma24 family protein